MYRYFSSNCLSGSWAVYPSLLLRVRCTLYSRLVRHEGRNKNWSHLRNVVIKRLIVVIRNPLQHRLSLAQSMAGSQKSEISSTKKNSYFFRLFTQREFTVLIYHFSDFAVYDNCIVLDLFCKLLASIYWICPMKMVIWLFSF